MRGRFEQEIAEIAEGGKERGSDLALSASLCALLFKNQIGPVKRFRFPFLCDLVFNL
jgi:hypothetical protein